MKNKINKFYSALFFCIASFFIFSVFVGFCNADTIFTDDFNSYSNGNIEGQGGWSGNGIDEFFLIEDNIGYENTKAVRYSTNFGTVGLSVNKSGNILSEGIITFYVKRDNFNTISKFRLFENPFLLAVEIIISPWSGNVGRISYKDSNNNLISLGSFPADTWYAVQIQWISSPSHQVRYSVNGGTWTDYVSPLYDWTTGLDRVNLYRDPSGGNTNYVYFDNIQENLVTNPLKTPILIIPGLIGTELEKENELLWADVSRMSTDITDNFMDILSFNKDSTPSDPEVSILDIIYSKKFSGVTLFDYTEGLVNEFKNKGYTEGSGSDATLFTFPYDWRYGVSGKFADGKTNIDLLEKKIQDIMLQTGSSNVDVIAHSLGGLLVKKYVMDNFIDHHIGKAVFVGVPNTGAPEAVKTLLQGDNLGMFFLSQNEIKKISENLPAIYDLLPSQKYYDVAGSFVEIIDEGDIFNSPTAPTTVKNLNYEEFKNYLTVDHELNNTALTGAENLHTQNFDDFDLRTAGVDLYAIDGCKAGTLTHITERRSINIFGQTLIDYKALKLGAGDNTVPLESATNLPIEINNKYYALAADHGKMLSQDGIRQKIVNILSDSGLEVNQNLITQDIAQCQLNGKAISVFSPVDIFVTDQNGNRLGLAQDQSIINEIPNANFEILGEPFSYVQDKPFSSVQDKHKFIYLPTDNGQIYNISMQGTDTGTFTIKNQEILNNQIIKTEVFLDIPVTQSLTGQINISIEPDVPTTLVLQQTSTDPFVTILPSSTIDANQSQDLLPPISDATISGTEGQDNFYRSDVAINLNSIDQEIAGQENQTSGVLQLHYQADNLVEQIVNSNTANILVSDEGIHNIKFFSTDKAGNKEQAKTLVFTIDKTPPEAQINFDPTNKDIAFLGIDNISDSSLVSIIRQNGVVTLSDQAGNTTDIGFLYKNVKTSKSAAMNLLKYNGNPVDISRIKMTFSWAYGRDDKLSKLSQYIKSSNGYYVSAVYDGVKTKISGLDASGKFSKSIAGLNIITVTTQEGDLKWSY